MPALSVPRFTSQLPLSGPGWNNPRPYGRSRAIYTGGKASFYGTAMRKYRVDTSTMRFCPKYTPLPPHVRPELQSSGTCSAAGLIKAFSAVLTWAPRSGSAPDVQKFQRPCHRSSCVITSPCSLPPPKQNAFSHRI